MEYQSISWWDAAFGGSVDALIEAIEACDWGEACESIKFLGLVFQTEIIERLRGEK